MTTESWKTLTDRVLTAQRQSIELVVAQSEAAEKFVAQGFAAQRKGFDLWLSFAEGLAKKAEPAAKA